MLTMRAGARAGIPIAIGVVPFGLVAGVAATEAGMGVGGAVAWSVAVFAGASQLAAIELLDSGATAVVAAGAALLINLRFLMYSAALAPYLASQSLGERLGAAYVLTDQAFGIAIAGYVREPRSSGRERLHFYLGVAALMWVTWQTTTVIGAVVGSTVPESVPLDFSIPLVFLALLIPSVTDRPTVVAAAVAGIGVVLAAELGAGNAALVIGVTGGIVAGAVVDLATGVELVTARVWAALVMAAVGSYLIRASFLVMARRMGEVGPVAKAVLRMIPPAALAGLVVPALVAPDGAVDLTNPRLWAGIVAAMAGWWTKQTLVTLGAGLAALVVLEAIMG